MRSKVILAAHVALGFGIALLPFTTTAQATSQPAPASPPSLSPQERVDILRADAMTYMNDYERSLSRPKSEPTVRELTHWAHAALALGMPAAKAEAFVRRAMALQEMDSTSPRYGTVMWQEGHPEIRDPNSIEFTMLPMGPILLRYTDKLSPSFAADMAPHVKAAIVAIRHHKVGVDYTNIYLMKLTNLILLGQASGDASAEADGVANLNTWLASTRANGITEYDSPTYSQVQLDVLGEGVLFVRDPGVKAKFQAALDYLESDLAANYFAPRHSLSGPHSRTYDWANGDGIVDRFYLLAGVIDSLSQQLKGKFGAAGLSDATRPLVNVLEGEPLPSDAIADLARLPERTIRSRFGPQPGQYRCNFITPDFAIGSSSAFYSAHDSELTLELPSPEGKPRLPIMSVVADEQDAPYGKPLLQRDGHRKPQHLKSAMAVVQDRGTILALLDLAPGLKNVTQQNVATNVLLPAAADEITLDGQPVSLSEKIDLPAKVGSIVGVRSGMSAAAVLLFRADGHAGAPAEVRLKWDQNEFGQARLDAYHYRGPTIKMNDTPVRAGLLLLARRCDSPEQYHQWLQQLAATPIDQSADPHTWRATAHVGDTTLSVTLDEKKAGPSEAQVQGKDVEPKTLEINGRDLSAEILAPIMADSGASR